MIILSLSIFSEPFYFFWAFLFFYCHLSLLWAKKSSFCSLFCYLFYRRLVEFNPEKHISVPQFYVMTFYLQFSSVFWFVYLVISLGSVTSLLIRNSLALWAHNTVGIMHFPYSAFGAGHFWLFTIVNVCRTILVPPLAGFYS